MGKFTQSVLNVDATAPTWELVESGKITIQEGDTSTSSQLLKTTDVTVKPEHLYFFKAIKKIQSTNTIKSCENVSRVYTQSSANTAPTMTTMVKNTKIGNTMDSYAAASSTSQGLWITLNQTTGKLNINKKYNSTNVPNWFGDYDYYIYELDISNVGE